MQDSLTTAPFEGDNDTCKEGIGITLQSFGKIGLLIDDHREASRDLGVALYGLPALPAWWIHITDSETAAFAVDTLIRIREAESALVVIDRDLGDGAWDIETSSANIATSKKLATAISKLRQLEGMVYCFFVTSYDAARTGKEDYPWEARGPEQARRLREKLRGTGDERERVPQLLLYGPVRDQEFGNGHSWWNAVEEVVAALHDGRNICMVAGALDDPGKDTDFAEPIRQLIASHLNSSSRSTTANQDVEEYTCGPSKRLTAWPLAAQIPWTSIISLVHVPLSAVIARKRLLERGDSANAIIGPIDTSDRAASAERAFDDVGNAGGTVLWLGAQGATGKFKTGDAAVIKVGPSDRDTGSDRDGKFRWVPGDPRAFLYDVHARWYDRKRGENSMGRWDQQEKPRERPLCFVGHVIEDEELAKKVAEMLEPKGICVAGKGQTGKRLDLHVTKKLDQANVYVLLYTDNAHDVLTDQTDREWVPSEFEYCIERGKTRWIVDVRTDKKEPRWIRGNIKLRISCERKAEIIVDEINKELDASQKKQPR